MEQGSHVCICSFTENQNKSTGGGAGSVIGLKKNYLQKKKKKKLSRPRPSFFVQVFLEPTLFVFEAISYVEIHLAA